MKYAYIQFTTLFAGWTLAIGGTVITAIPFFQDRAQASDWFGLALCLLAAIAGTIGSWAGNRAA